MQRLDGGSCSASTDRACDRLAPIARSAQRCDLMCPHERINQRYLLVSRQAVPAHAMRGGGAAIGYGRALLRDPAVPQRCR